MTINELLEAGIILQGLGRVYASTEPDERHPYGQNYVLYDSKIIDLYSPIESRWADREIKYIFTVPGVGPYPMLCIEVE